MDSWWRRKLGSRPWWMDAMMVFSAFMAFAYMPWDIFVKPVDVDEEVWFGIIVHGWAAKATEPLHWAIYAAGAYGFWQMRRWMWPWASLYVAQVAVGMLVWSAVYLGGLRGLLGGLAAFVPFALLAVALWRARDQFGEKRGEAPAGSAT